MAVLWRKLHIVAVTWLVFQVAGLTALVPRDCCAAHRRAEKSCHQSRAAKYCPMAGADGTPCPMHRASAVRTEDDTAASAGHSDHDTPRSESTACRLAGTCSGSMTALLGLSHHGILPASTLVLPATDARVIREALRENLVRESIPPEPPPPRA